MTLILKLVRLAKRVLSKIENSVAPKPSYQPLSNPTNATAGSLKGGGFASAGKKLKIALCFSGQIRNLDKGYEYIYKNIIEPNKSDCQIDVFAHIWFSQEEIGKTYVAASGVLVDSPVSKTAVMDIYKYYNPQKILLEKPIDFDEKNYNDRKPDAIIPKFSLSKNYSIKKSFELKKEHEKQNNFTYDLVMSIRLDLGINNQVVFKNFDPNIVTHSEKGFYEGEGVDVCFAIMGGKLADKYGSFFDYMDQYYNEGIRFCDEPLMHRHLDFHKIPFIRTKELNDYTLLR